MASINDMLEEEIQEVITELNKHEVGSKEYSAVLTHLNSLYRMRTEARKAEKEVEKVEVEKLKMQLEKEKLEVEKLKISSNTKNEADRIEVEKQKIEADELKAKKDRFWSNVIKGAEIGVTVLGIGTRVFMFTQGLNWESTGSISSAFMRALTNMDPLKK